MLHISLKSWLSLQVDKAVEYLEEAKELDERDEVMYDVRVRRSNSSATGRGIYLREPLDSHRAVTCVIDVRPTVHEVAILASCQQIFFVHSVHARHSLIV